MKNVYLFFSKYKIIHILYWIYAIFNLWHTLQLQRGADYVFNTYDLMNDIFCQMACVYIIIYYLIPKYFHKLHYIAFFCLSIGFVGLFSILNSLVAMIYVDWMRAHAFTMSNIINLIAHFIDIVSVSALFAIVILIEYYIKKDQKNKLLEKERLEAELNFLKAQMNPHFLFNALNSIYFLIDQNVELSKDVLLKFSSLLRYQLYDCSIAMTTLKDEIQFLNNYIDLEKIRNSENIAIAFHQPKHDKNYYIAPLLLIPFVENAFKYVSKSGAENNFIAINCTVDENHWLHFDVENTFKANVEKTNSNGLGIINVKRRLELLYPNQFELTIDKQLSVFKVNLKILLK